MEGVSNINVGLVNHTLWKPYGVWANNEFI